MEFERRVTPYWSARVAVPAIMLLAAMGATAFAETVGRTAGAAVLALLLVKEATWSSLSVAPTDMTLLRHAGAAISVPDPALPDEAKAMTPLARNVLMADAPAMANISPRKYSDLNSALLSRCRYSSGVMK